MSHAFARNHIHLVFGCNGRRRSIPPTVQEDLWAYMRGIARNYDTDVLAINGTEDHVHMLIDLPPKLSLAHAVSALKANSSKWMNENGHSFRWQEGYGAFSVSTSNLHDVEEYIRHQAEHHAKYSFTQEYLALLKKHGVEVCEDEAFGEWRPSGSPRFAALTRR